MRFTRFIPLLLCFVPAVGCGPKSASPPEPKYVLSGLWGGTYVVPKGAPRLLESGGIAILLDKFNSYGMETDITIDVRVKNKGDREVVFDPGLVELFVPETGMSFFHISKDKSSVSVPATFADVLLPTKLKPDQLIAGRLMFPTGKGRALVTSLEVRFGDESIVFPSGEKKSASTPKPGKGAKPGTETSGPDSAI